jgi:type VI secretion system secreted protein Hcp
MAVDIFMKIPETEGEVTVPGFEGCIAVTEWRWGIQGGGHNRTGETQVQNVEVKKQIDRSSPNLWQFCFQHMPMPEVTLSFRKAGVEPLVYLTLTLKNTYVVSTNMEVGAQGEVPLEVVVLNFKGFDAEYQPQGADGAAEGGAVEVSWEAIDAS